jgi:hypothetical protein
MVDDPKLIIECFLCRRTFRFGPQQYDGRAIPQWGTTVCRNCYDFNWDGVVPDRFPHLVPYLQSQGIEVRYNANGWINFPA